MANFAQLGIQINSNADDAANDLDKLTAAGGRAEQSTKRLTKATQDQEKELNDLLGQIDPTVRALGRLDEQERKLAQFRKSGQLDTDSYTRFNTQIQQQRQLLGGLSDAQGRASKSAKELAFATRGLPAQFTDIAVSLQGGQNPLNVFLQQGGQLKDMFGGIGPAAKAMGGYIAGLINPFTVAAAAVAALAIAWKQGSDEATEFNKALILTGNTTGLTANNLAALALQMDAIAGVTMRSASKALTEVASTGAFTAEQIELVATAAEAMRAATGKAVGETVSEFQKLKGDPVSAILALNESYHFLDQTQLENIKTLVEQGRQTDAVTAAFQLHAAQLNSKSSQVVENLGSIERGWRAIKSAAAEAWDFMLDVGRDSTPAREIAVVEAQIKNIQLAAGVTGRLSESAQKEIDALQVRVDKMRADLQKKPVQVVMAGIYSDAGKSQFDAQQQLEAQARSLDKVKRQEYEIAEIRRKGRLAYGVGFENGKEVDDPRTAKLIADYTAKQADSEERKARARSTGNADNNSATTLLATAQRQVEANQQLISTGEQLTATDRLIIQINQRLADSTNTMTAATRQELIAARESLTMTNDQSKARQQLTRDTAANAAITERMAQIYRQQQDQNEVSLMGIGRGSQAADIAQRELNIRRDYLGEVEKLEKAQRNRNTELSAAEYQRQKELLANSLNERLALEQSYQDQRMAMLGDWRNGATAAFEDYSARAADVAGQFKSLFEGAFQGAEDAFVRFVMTGKLSFSDMAKSIIADLARIAAKQAIVGAIGSIVGSIAGGIATRAGNVAVSQGTQSINQQISDDWFKGNGFSGGGYTGPGGKYEVAGYVHRDEVVWNKEDVAAVGGPRAANAMRPTAGYATGGIVGASQPRGVGQNAAPQITFIMSMQDGSISSNQQGGGADGSTRELKQMFEAMINAWWTKNNRPGGAAYNMRMGTA